MPNHSSTPVLQGVATLQAARITRAMLCLTLFLPVSHAMGQQFGILFTSPEEREYLDYLREENLRLSQENTFNIRDDVIPVIPVIAEATEEVAGPAVSQYRFGGIMDRRNGSRLVWLNGAQVAENALPANIRLVSTTAGILLSITADNINYQLKPGQTYDVVAGRILESYQSTPTPAPTLPSPASSEPSVRDDAAVNQSPGNGEFNPSTTAANGSGQSDLANILQSLVSEGEEPSEEDLQRALEILGQQENPSE